MGFYRYKQNLLISIFKALDADGQFRGGHGSILCPLTDGVNAGTANGVNLWKNTSPAKKNGSFIRRKKLRQRFGSVRWRPARYIVWLQLREERCPWTDAGTAGAVYCL